ncbi:MAG: glycosyltransferase [Beijerinckiaceae bacterium]
MKIALYVHCFFPRHFYGTEAYTLALAKELAAAGHEPIVVSATLAGEPRQGNVIEEYTHEGVRVVSIDKNHFPNRGVRASYEQPALRHLHERLLRQLRPDVIHVCHLISHTTALLDVARRMEIPVFATLTDFFGFCYTNQLESAEGALCEGPDPERANCIACFLKLASSRPNAEFLARLGGHRGVRAPVARQLARLGRREQEPFTISSFAPNDIVLRPAILRRAMAAYRAAIAPTLFLKGAYERNGFPAPLRLSHFGIDIDRSPKPVRNDPRAVKLGFIGQLTPHKGAHLLVEAFRASGRGNLSLTVFGPQDQDLAYYAKLRRQAEGLEIKFLGILPRTELAAAFGALDYLAIPSTWYENSPLILLQALATHTPVIVADVSGMTEFVENGVNGFHFSRGNIGSLTGILRRIADEPNLARKMCAASSYERVPADMASDVLALYAAHGVAATN